jgi:predicted NUDIX family NTP pyrophosphohydrolase
MPLQSAGILLFRYRESLEVLLAHPGGPFFKNKNEGAWTIPKGLISEDESPLKAAIREFEEETGTKVSGDFIPLAPIRFKSGKTVHAWALEGDLEAEHISCNTFPLEWPPKSGQMQDFPEIDRAEWFTIPEAEKKIHPAQLPFIEELLSKT